MANDLFNKLESQYGLPAGLLDSVWSAESARGKNMRSPAGAMGHFQFMPATAKEYGLSDPSDLVQSATAAARKFSDLKKAYQGDTPKMLAAYNWGNGNLDRQGLDRAPAETRNYIKKVSANMGTATVGRDLSADLFGESPAKPAQAAGRDLSAELFAPEPGMLASIAQGAGNLAAGAVRGAGSIGATVMRVLPNALGGDTAQENAARRQSMDDGLQSMGAQPDSWMYKGGKLAGEIAGTAGAGGVLGNGVRALGATRALTGLEPIVNGVARGLETGGFRVGELAGTGLAAAARIGTGVATGGAAAGLVDPGTAGTGAIIGGAMPGAAQLAGKAGGAIRNAVTGGGAAPEVAALARRAKELGVNIPADRLVNSRPLNALASSLNYVPLSGRAATEDAMNSQLNQALSRTFGQDSSNVTMALRKAGPKLGGEFDRVLKSNTVKVDPQFMQELAEAGNRASSELGSDGATIIGKQIDEILAKAGTGEIDGQAAYNIKKTLDRIGKRNTPEAYYAGDLRKSLMGALNRSLGPDEAASFATTRQQYGSMLDLQKLAKNGAEGEVSIARLANMSNIKNPEMQELADIAAQFVKPRESQHGAMQRVVLGTGAGLAGMMGGGVMAGGAGLAGAALAGRGANSILNSNTLKELMLRPAGKMIGEPATLNRLTQAGYRAAPLLPAQ